MKCSKCGEELNEKWAMCPFCGTKVPKVSKTINEFLKEFVEDYGPSIFMEENSNRLERAMGDWPEIYADDRDIVKLLQIKNIPDRLCSALDMPPEKQSKVVQESANILCNKFGIKSDFSAKMISLITDAIGLKTGVSVGDINGTFEDPRDGQVYKTCKIGNQVWLAENLKFDTGSGCYVYDDDYQYLDKYGYMYSSAALSKAIPEGWHLPTEGELKTLSKFIVKSNRCKSAIPYLLVKEWWANNKQTDEDPNDFVKHLFSDIKQSDAVASGKKQSDIDETTLDSYGFSALPGGCYDFDCFGDVYHGLGELSKWWVNWVGHDFNTYWYFDMTFGDLMIEGCLNSGGARVGRYYVRLIKD